MKRKNKYPKCQFYYDYDCKNKGSKRIGGKPVCQKHFIMVMEKIRSENK